MNDELNSAVVQYLAQLHSRGLVQASIYLNQQHLGHFISWLKETQQIHRPSDLTGTTMVAWHQHISQRRRADTGTPLRPHSIHSYLRATRAFNQWLVCEGLAPLSLMRDYPVWRLPSLPYKFALPHAQVRKLVRTISNDTPEGHMLRALAEFFYSTGARPCEVLRMNVGDVDFENAQVRLLGKGNKERMVPVGRQALRYLESYLRGIRPLRLRRQDETAFWLNQLGGRYKRQTFQKYWQRTVARREPIFGGVTPYAFRRACATELVRGGADLWAVKEILGHESYDMLIHYVRPELADLKKMHAKYHPRDRGMDDTTSLPGT